jgi:hypothetical protein
MIIKGTQFTRTRIELDNASYEDCTFTECEIVYSAKGPVHAEGLRFINCRFRFDRAARATMDFLTAMYQFAAPVVEATFDNIRGGGSSPSNTDGWVTAG